MQTEWCWVPFTMKKSAADFVSRSVGLSPVLSSGSHRSHLHDLLDLKAFSTFSSSPKNVNFRPPPIPQSVSRSRSNPVPSIDPTPLNAHVEKEVSHLLSTAHAGEEVYQKIEHIIRDVPLGFLDLESINFAFAAIRLLAKKGNLLVGTKLLDRLVQEVSCRTSQHSNYLSETLVFPYNQIIRSYAYVLPEPHSKLGSATLNLSTLPTMPGGAVEQAYALFQSMKERHDINPARHPAPDTFTFHAMLFVCANHSAHHDGATKLAERIIRSMEQAQQQGQAGAVPLHTTHYNNVILCHANRAGFQYGSAMAAEDWLMHMSQQASTDPNATARPNTNSFNRVLKAWADSPEQKGAERAHTILDLMIRLHKQDEEDNVQNQEWLIKPDVFSFHTVITAYGKRSQPDLAESILTKFLEFFAKNNAGERPVDATLCINAAMIAWSRSSRPQACERVRSIFQHAMTLSGNQQLPVTMVPDTATHAAIVKAYVRSTDHNGLEMADSYLRSVAKSYLERPSYLRHQILSSSPPASETLNDALHGWLRSDRPLKAERAHELLIMFMQLSEKCESVGMTPQAFASNPDSESFNLCIKAWCQSSSERRADMAHQVLLWAEARRCANVSSYTMVIKALCQVDRGGRAILAANVLSRLERFIRHNELKRKPNLREYYDSVTASLCLEGSAEATDLHLTLVRSMRDIQGSTSSIEV